MAELRLEDVGAILVALVMVSAAYTMIRVGYFYRSEIGLFLGALWRRYVAVGDWRAAMERLADERGDVNRYGGGATSDTSSGGGWEEDDRAFAIGLQQNNNTATMDCNAAPENNALLLQQQAAIVARFVKAGVVGETKALQIAFNAKPSSTSKSYQEARDALKTELAKLDLPAQATPIAGRRTRAVFHNDKSGA